MKRDYTKKAYNLIKLTIERIDNTDVYPVTEFLSDLFLRLMQYLEIYSVEKYQNDMQSWYNITLDSHNSTMSFVDKVFNDVDTVDFQYRDTMNGALESIVSFQNTLNCLRDVISGKTSYADGKAAADGHLADGKKSLNSAYDTILTRMESRHIWESSLELLGDAIKLGTGYAVTCLSLRSGDPFKVAVSIKKFADDVVASFFDLLAEGTVVAYPVIALATKGVASIFGAEISYERYLDKRFDVLTRAQGLKDTNSVSDWLGGIADDMEEDLVDCPKDSPYYSFRKFCTDTARKLADASEVVDVAADAYDIVSDVKDLGELVLGKEYTTYELLERVEKEEYRKGLYITKITESNDGLIYKVRLSPGETISELFSVPSSGWDDPQKVDGNIWKTVSTIWSYTEKFVPDPVTGQMNTGELPDVALDKFKVTKFPKDVLDFAKDFIDSTKEPVGYAKEPVGYAKDPFDFKWDYLRTGVN